MEEKNLVIAERKFAEDGQTLENLLTVYLENQIDIILNGRYDNGEERAISESEVV